ncbi:hypothetical protein PF002_g699 [Phytophthora fragariae]|uniref:Uncharacterized protein n=1 Tax=Phytophthora fragariae TaxID=53985 RepID=A0A6A3FXA3_9STRA|nr:hypothetical protein PF009_g280 [Phytophthora fragariae]KAE9141145.1 hypothetical protein PF007_g342 [Phytophthora fragariae]KAE9255975.1 hypothetical protein PF004_g322 [Phytophthora fragariae]KAE9257787.1 hypothetical protein PF002_g699 [Phytophthora fragariae]KAE9330523.1 hypothetical protein PF001_g349 [Phytophthora fragariae]
MKRQSGEGGIVQQPRGRCEQKESSESLTSELSRITIRDATWDQLVQRMKVGDLGHPGIAISWADDATVHACLGVAGAPIPQEANEAASGAALRAWFSGLVVAANANSPVMLAEGIRSSEFFDHLSIDDYAVITRELQVAPMLVWGLALQAGGVSVGRFYIVTASRRGRNHAMEQSYPPFFH